MCQTAIISHSIGILGRKSYDRRMRVVSPLYVEKRGEMTRLCNGLERLCTLLHTEFPTITKADYEVFGPELKILIDTLMDLLTDSKKLGSTMNDRLRVHVDDLIELNHDIVKFRINLQENKELQKTMKAIGKLDFSKYIE